MPIIRPCWGNPSENVYHFYRPAFQSAIFFDASSTKHQFPFKIDWAPPPHRKHRAESPKSTPNFKYQATGKGFLPLPF